MRRPVSAALAGFCCAAVAFGPVGVALAQGAGPWDTEIPQGPGAEVGVLELPPLPTVPVEDEHLPAPSDDSSGVQTLALGLAGAALVAGAAGLVVVTRRGRGDDSDDESTPRERAVPDPRRDLGLAGDAGR